MCNRFDEQLELPNVELIRMGSLYEDAIQGASKALTGESVFAERVHATEHEISQKERDIENLCFRLLSKQQPATKDSRLVSTMFKVISDMKCIDGQASDTVEIATYLKDSEVGSKVHINNMTEATMKMVTTSTGSLVGKNLEIARGVIKSDDVVDNLFDEMGEELIGLIGENRVNRKLCTDLLVIAKYFERIRDYVTNTAEWAEYPTTRAYTII